MLSSIKRYPQTFTVAGKNSICCSAWYKNCKQILVLPEGAVLEPLPSLPQDSLNANVLFSVLLCLGGCSREANELDGLPVKRRKYDFSEVSQSVNSPTVSLTAAISASQSSFHGAIRGVQQLVPSSSISSRPSIKLTMAKPVPRLTYPKPVGAPQKVIIVSGTGVSSATTICASPQTMFPQKSVVVSVMKTSTSVPLPTVVTSFTMNPVTPSVGNLTVANSFVGGGVSGSQIVRCSSAHFPQVNVQNSKDWVVAVLKLEMHW